MMSYKGYAGVVEVDDEAGVIRGRVVNTRDTITFQGETVDAARAAFRESVDDYLEFCQELGEEPDKPFSGTILVRLKPEVHRELSMVAQVKGVSVNRLVTHQIKRVVRKESGTFVTTADVLVGSGATSKRKAAARAAIAKPATPKKATIAKPAASKSAADQKPKVKARTK